MARTFSAAIVLKGGPLDSRDGRTGAEATRGVWTITEGVFKSPFMPPLRSGNVVAFSEGNPIRTRASRVDN